MAIKKFLSALISTSLITSSFPINGFTQGIVTGSGPSQFRGKKVGADGSLEGITAASDESNNKLRMALAGVDPSRQAAAAQDAVASANGQSYQDIATQLQWQQMAQNLQSNGGKPGIQQFLSVLMPLFMKQQKQPKAGDKITMHWKDKNGKKMQRDVYRSADGHVALTPEEAAAGVNLYELRKDKNGNEVLRPVGRHSDLDPDVTESIRNKVGADYFDKAIKDGHHFIIDYDKNEMTEVSITKKNELIPYRTWAMKVGPDGTRQLGDLTSAYYQGHMLVPPKDGQDVATEFQIPKEVMAKFAGKSILIDPNTHEVYTTANNMGDNIQEAIQPMKAIHVLGAPELALADQAVYKDPTTGDWKILQDKGGELLVNADPKGGFDLNVKKSLENLPDGQAIYFNNNTERIVKGTDDTFIHLQKLDLNGSPVEANDRVLSNTGFINTYDKVQLENGVIQQVKVKDPDHALYQAITPKGADTKALLADDPTALNVYSKDSRTGLLSIYSGVKPIQLPDGSAGKISYDKGGITGLDFNPINHLSETLTPAAPLANHPTWKVFKSEANGAIYAEVGTTEKFIPVQGEVYDKAASIPGVNAYKEYDDGKVTQIVGKNRDGNIVSVVVPETGSTPAKLIEKAVFDTTSGKPIAGADGVPVLLTQKDGSGPWHGTFTGTDNKVHTVDENPVTGTPMIDKMDVTYLGAAGKDGPKVQSGFTEDYVTHTYQRYIPIDGKATLLRWNPASGNNVAYDSKGNGYVVDRANGNVIRKIVPVKGHK